MKQNKYNDKNFFDKYSKMERSIGGLESAGEWHILKTMLPDFNDKNVLDIGCGFGWHCRYASSEGAKSVLGIDISSEMLKVAKEKTNDDKIKYKCIAMEDIDFSKGEFDVVISSLAFHYTKDFDIICKKIYDCLSDKGSFVFSVEHPIFTAKETQDWCYGEHNEILYWPVDDYQYEGIRKTSFLGEEVIKYHRTIETYINTLIKNGFIINNISEPVPPISMVEDNEYLKNEFRRPMFLMISCSKSM